MTQDQARWPIGELAARAAAALAVDYTGAGSGRVRDVPDVRAIRWYRTIGLIDKPAGYRGRTALYGPRHLLQLGAVKRRQAAGAPLAQIQAELTGADDTRLASVAALPAGSDAEPSADLTFWKDQPVRVSVDSRHGNRRGVETSTMSYGIQVSDQVTILVRSVHPPDSDDIAAIHAASEPLRHMLRARGLTTEGAAT